jgi:NAD(P)-dependent dehydrogenase (short-subunit alcohol dehydrogenase family)
MQTVKDKTVLVTGAAMGMGKLYAQRAVDEGAAAVVLWDIDEQALAATARELEARGGRVRPYVVDVSSVAQIRTAAALVRENVGTVDVLINNAGVVRGNKWFWEHDAERDVASTMAINALAPMYVAHEFLPGMIESKRPCRVVTIASASGLVPVPRLAVYSASKWAATGWSDALRLELEECGHRHVRVTTVNPAYIATGMFEGVRAPLLTPLLTPDYVVDRVWRAMCRGAPRVWLPWTVYLASALKGLLPVRVFDALVGYGFGVYKTMETFQGRGGR